MKLKHKLSALLALAAAAPIAVAGWSTLAIAERSAIRAAEEAERLTARTTAARLSAEVARIRDLLRLFAHGSFDFGALDPADVSNAERLIYSLDDRITITSILRSDGTPAGPSYYRRPGDGGSHAEVSPGALADHGASVPLAEAISAGEAISPIYRNRDGKVRIAVAAVADPGNSDDARQPLRLIVIAEVALDELVAAAAPGVELLDARGNHVGGPVFLPAPSAGALAPASWGPAMSLRSGELLASLASVPGLGWGVATARPLGSILAPARDLRRRIVFWVLVGVLAALLTGGIFARGMTGPLEELFEAANDFGAGRMNRRVAVQGNDELALVGNAFNGMAEDLAASHAQLSRWNAELEQKVKERTAELRDAIEQLLLAHRLAAIGQLGAGVAHEINNPLTYLVGALQLLEQAPVDKRAKMILQCHQSARRIQEVVLGLLKVSQPNGDGQRIAADVNTLVDNALLLVGGQLKQAGIKVTRELSAQLPRIYADPSQLTQALVQIFTNARDAMPDGGELRIATRGAIGDKLVMVRIVDTGKGIPADHLDRLFDPFFTTQAASGHRGLGLSLAYRILKDHGGSIHPESEPGNGTCFTLRLPALPRELSLA